MYVDIWEISEVWAFLFIFLDKENVLSTNSCSSKQTNQQKPLPEGPVLPAPTKPNHPSFRTSHVGLFINERNRPEDTNTKQSYSSGPEKQTNKKKTHKRYIVEVQLLKVSHFSGVCGHEE